MISFIELTNLSDKKILVNVGAALTVVSEDSGQTTFFFGETNATVQESYGEVKRIMGAYLG